MRWCWFASCFVLATVCAAQGTTWIVDKSNGPGTHFTEIQDALVYAQVVDGDTLIVRPGNYAQCSTSKGVTILAQPGAVISQYTAAAPLLAVTGLGAGKTFVLDGLTFYAILFGGSPCISLQNAQGRIHLDGVTTKGPWPSSAYPPAVQIVSCRLVTMNRCTITQGDPFHNSFGIHSRNSNLMITGGRVDGPLANYRPRVLAGPGIDTIGGSLWLSMVTVQGGSGSTGFFVAPPGPALSCTGTVVTIAGDARASLRAGGGEPTPTSAILLIGGSLRIDPRVVLAPNGAAPPIAGSGSVSTGPIALADVASAPPGGMLACEVVSEAGDAVALALSLPGPEVSSPFGTLFLDPASLLPIAVAVQGSGGRLTRSVPVPNDLSLRGLLLVSQALNRSASSSVLVLTNPVFFALDY